MRWLFVLTIADRDVADEYGVTDRHPVATVVEVIPTVAAVHGEHTWFDGYEQFTDPTVTVNGRLFQRFTERGGVGRGNAWWLEPGAVTHEGYIVLDDERLTSTARTRRVIYRGGRWRADRFVEALDRDGPHRIGESGSGAGS